MTMASTMLSGAGHAYGPLPTKITPISGATSSLATGASASAGTSGQSSARWLAAYFVCNLTLTIYNKVWMCCVAQAVLGAT